MSATCLRPVTTPATETTTPRVAWPSPIWHAELRRQATTATIEAATRCARIEIDRLRRLGGGTELEPSDLVQDLLMATCAGTLSWSPDVVPLVTHLRDKVRLACRRHRRRLRGRPGSKAIALDALGSEDPIWQDVEAALASDLAPPDATVVALGRQLMIELRGLVAADPIARCVLDQLGMGTTGTADVVAATGLTPAAVEGARRRLQRAARRTSPDLREEIARVL